MNLGLSVVVTTYNRANKLRLTLASIAAQTRVPDELIVTDNASSDETAEVVAEFNDLFPLLRYNRNSKNVGMPRNLNIGISLASGNLIANLHDADEFDPMLLEKWEKAMIANPSAGMVFCGLDGRTNGDETQKVWLYDIKPLTHGKNFFSTHYVAAAGSPIWGTAMVRKSVYQKYMPFDEQFMIWADVDMWMRICSTEDIAYVNEPLIILDSSPTAHRKFSWLQFVITHRMPFLNCHRMFAHPAELHENIIRQQRRLLYCYRNHLASRLLRGEIKSLMLGLSLMPDILHKLKCRTYEIPRDKLTT